MRNLLFVFFILIQTKSFAQIICKASENPLDGYNQITKAGLDYESPDCVHGSFGNHISQVFDSILKRPVFVFHSHIEEDNDRCQVFDRVRMEIKGGPNTSPESQHLLNSTSFYRWKFMLPSDFQGSSSFCHIFQNKIVGGNDTSFPLITLTPRANILEVIHNGGNSGSDLGRLTSIDLSLIKGRWIEAYIHQFHSENGYFELILKDLITNKIILHYVNKNIDLWRAGAEYSRPKWGMYRLKSSSLKDEMIRFSDFCISESDSLLCPSEELVIVDTIAPTSPQNLMVTNKTRTTVSLAWNASSDNIEVDHYQILRNGDIIKTITDLSFVDTGLFPGTTYSYTIIASDVAGNISIPSHSVDVITDDAGTFPALPILVNPQNDAQNISTSTDLTWQKTNNAQSYRIYCSVDSIPRYLDSIGNTTYTLDLAENTVYFWQIGAINENGESKSEIRAFKTRSSNSSNQWLIYRANNKMHIETNFFELNASPEMPLQDTIIKDSNGSENTFYVYADQSDKNFRWRHRFTANEKTITVVARIKAFSEDIQGICYFEFRIGGWREKVRINQSSIKLERSTPLVEVPNPFNWLQEFHLVRITMEDKITKVYLDENPEPIAVGESNESNSSNYFEWGKSGTTPYASMIDWLVIDETGAYAPNEGSMLPADLFLSSDATLSTLSIDGLPVANFDPYQLEYTVTVSEENEPIITFETSSSFATSTIYTADMPPKNYIEIKVDAQDGWTQKIYKINFEKTTSITNSKWDSPILVFPNPTRNKLNVTFDGPSKGVYYLNDVIGSLKMSSKFQDNFEMDLSHLPRGMYLLHLMMKDRLLVTKKIIIE